MGWISWLCPGINLKRWLLLFAVGVLLCALGLALFFNYQLMGKAEELLFQMTYLTTGRYSNTLIMALGVLLLLVGFGIMIYGTRRLISSVVSVVIPDKLTNPRIMMATTITRIVNGFFTLNFSIYSRACPT